MRLLVLALTAAGFMVQMSLRVSLSVVIVAMVNHTAIPHTAKPAPQTCTLEEAGQSVLADGNITASSSTNVTNLVVAPKREGEEGEFVWDELEQGALLSSFYWGYLVTQMPGGYLAERFGSKIVLGVSQTMNGLLFLLLPVATRGGLPAAAAVRVLQGLVCGPVYPCLLPLVARWFPLDERQRAFGTVHALTALAVSAATALAGQVSAALGWRAVFYMGGGAALLWAVAWFALVQDTPERHPLASEEERRRIGAGNVTQARTRRRPPYLKMARSPPVLAIVAAETANSWALTYLMTSLPTYMKHVLGYDLKASGALSGLPLLGRAVTLFLAGAAADLALRRGWMSTEAVRRSAAALVSIGGAVLLLIVTLVGCRPAIAATCFVLGGMFNGFIATGHMLNPLDIAPNYSGSVFGIANFVGNGISMLNPVVTGAMIRGEQTAERWNRVFYLGAGIFGISLVLYQSMMSTRRQGWDTQQEEEDAAEADGTEMDNGGTNNSCMQESEQL